MFLQWSQLRDVYLETSTAVIQAAPTLSMDQVVRTPGHTLASNDLLRTLSVEATIHQPDLIVTCPVRISLQLPVLPMYAEFSTALLGHQVAVQWTDEQYARTATGRAQLPDTEQRQLGQDASRFPYSADSAAWPSNDSTTPQAVLEAANQTRQLVRTRPGGRRR